MPNLLIVSHTPSPRTHQLTDAVLRGAGHADFNQISVRHKAPLESNADDVLWCDGILLGTTENFGYMSGAMKDFFDRIYYPCLERKQGLPYALFIRAGNDGLGARSSIERIVTGLAWKPVQEPLICRGDWQDEFLEQAEELGMLFAAGLEAGVF